MCNVFVISIYLICFWVTILYHLTFYFLFIFIHYFYSCLPFVLLFSFCFHCFYLLFCLYSFAATSFLVSILSLINNTFCLLWCLFFLNFFLLSLPMKFNAFHSVLLLTKFHRDYSRYDPSFLLYLMKREWK